MHVDLNILIAAMDKASQVAEEYKGGDGFKITNAEFISTLRSLHDLCGAFIGMVEKEKNPEKKEFKYIIHLPEPIVKGDQISIDGVMHKFEDYAGLLNCIRHLGMWENWVNKIEIRTTRELKEYFTAATNYIEECQN